ncbi:MAG: sulfatase [Armatimonadota bacterium]|nr:sulfatase [Armatimonadota bacterium]
MTTGLRATGPGATGATMKRRRFLQMLGAGVASMGLVGAQSGPSRGAETGSDGPNVLLITAEDMGPQLSSYGDETISTPHLDRLAESGARFTNAYVTQAVCSPSRASILTGLHPHQHGQIGLATHRYAMFEEYANIPGLLKQIGYRTGILGKLHVNPSSVFPFDYVWREGRSISFQHRDVERIAEVAGDFIADSAQPFFLMVNYPDAHLPFIRQDHGLPAEPLGPDDVRALPALGVDTPRLRGHVANYYNCIKRLDEGIGLLLAQLTAAGRDGDTLIIFLGDHGPQFSRGKCAVYELALQVPMIVRWPEAPAGQVRDELVSAIDILPAILDALGAEAPPALPGRSLRPLARGEQTQWRRYLFAEWNTSHPYPPPTLLFPQRSVRDERYKLIRTLLPDTRSPIEKYYTSQALVDTGTTQEEIDAAAPQVRAAYQTWRNPPPEELYDLAEDPHEFTNLAEDPQLAPVRERLSSELDAWQERTGDALADPEKLQMLVEENERVSARLKETKRRVTELEDFRWGYLDYLREG